jgi:hypothetical protein
MSPGCDWQVAAKIGSPSHFLNDGLSLNCWKIGVICQEFDYHPL